MTERVWLELMLEDAPSHVRPGVMDVTEDGLTLADGVTFRVPKGASVVGLRVRLRDEPIECEGRVLRETFISGPGSYTLTSLDVPFDAMGLMEGLA